MEGEQALFSKRELLEAQQPAVLNAHKAELLRRLSDLESEIHLVNDVLDGYGYTRYDPGMAYDAADDGTFFQAEHPEDERWAVRSNN